MARLNSSVVWFAVSALLISACAGTIIGVMVTNWKSSAASMWQLASTQTQDRIVQAINGSLSFIKFAALALPSLEPNLGAPDAALLSRAFYALDAQSGYTIESFGSILPDPNEAGKKYEQQVAYKDGCPEYIYAYTNATIHPLFYGFCSYQNGTVDWSALAYNGTDWGQKPIEMQIFSGAVMDTFMPVDYLLGQATLTYEAGYPQDVAGPKTAITFGEIDLITLSDFVAGLDVMNGEGTAYVVEATTGYMIACTTPSAVVDSAGVRLFARNSTVSAVGETYGAAAAGVSGGPVSDLSVGSWRISVYPYSDVGVDWVVVVAVPESSVYGNVKQSIDVAVGVSVAAVVLALVAALVFSLFCMNRSVGRVLGLMRGENPARPWFGFSDFEPVETQLEARDGTTEASSSAARRAVA